MGNNGKEQRQLNPVAWRADTKREGSKMNLGSATVYAVTAAELEYISWADVEAFAAWLAANEDESEYLALGMSVIIWNDSKTDKAAAERA